MTIRAALVKKGSDQTSADYSTPTKVAWGTEIYDYNSFFTTSANTRLTCRPGTAGRYGVAYATLALESVTSGSTITLIIYKDGAATYRGVGAMRQQAGASTGQVSGGHWIHVRTAPVLLASGTYFEAELTSTDTSITVKAHSNFGLHVRDAFSTQMVLATKNADSTGSYNTPTAIVWDGTDIYDTDAVHNPASNNTKLIIPSSMNGKHVIISSANFGTNMAQFDFTTAITKNGSFTYDGFSGNGGLQGLTYGVAGNCVETPPLLVATGDELECVAFHNDTDTAITHLGDSTFGLRVVDY